MNRRLALGKLIAGFAATTTVSAKDFDPRIGAGSGADMPCTASENNRRQDKFYELTNNLPPRIAAGFQWIQQANGTSIQDQISYYELRTRVAPALVPRKLYRWMVERAYLSRLEACKPELTEQEWAECRRIFDAHQKVFRAKQMALEEISGAVSAILRMTG